MSSILATTVCLSSSLLADVLMELESGRYDTIERGVADAKRANDYAAERYYLSEIILPRRPQRAGDLLSDVSTQTFTAADWLKNYIAEVQPAREK